MIFRTSFLVLVISAITSLASAIPQTETGQGAKVPSVEELIGALRSPDFKAREAATRALLKRQGVEPALRKALATEKSEEARTRISQILKELEVPAIKLSLRALSRRLRDGRVDEAVDQMSALGENLNDESWKSAYELAEKLFSKAKKDGKGSFFSSVPNIPKLEKYKRVLNLANRPFPFPQIPLGWNGQLIVSQGPLQLKVILVNGIIFANGNVAAKAFHHSIIVCDGSVEAENCFQSLIIATGEVRTKDSHSHIIANAHEALGLLKFFNTSTLGVDVISDKNGVLVKRVQRATAFGNSGIREGDHLVKINGVKITGQDDFRRQVRHAAVGNQETAMTVERRGETIELSVKLGNGRKDKSK